MMILFYSKIDPESTMILSIINQDADLKNIIKLVSIDSKQIHDIVSTSKNVVIDNIPCLLSLNEQSIFKYEGSQKIIEVFDELKRNIQKQKAPAYTSLIDINLEPEPILEQHQSTDNVSPEKIKITSPVFSHPKVKK